MKLDISKSARLDLAELWNHGSDVWGDDRADRYLNSLYDALELLTENPKMGMAVPKLGDGVRRWVHNPYNVFTLLRPI